MKALADNDSHYKGMFSDKLECNTLSFKILNIPTVDTREVN